MLSSSATSTKRASAVSLPGSVMGMREAPEALRVHDSCRTPAISGQQEKAAGDTAAFRCPRRLVGEVHRRHWLYNPGL